MVSKTERESRHAEHALRARATLTVSRLRYAEDVPQQTLPLSNDRAEGDWGGPRFPVQDRHLAAGAWHGHLAHDSPRPPPWKPVPPEATTKQ